VISWFLKVCFFNCNLYRLRIGESYPSLPEPVMDKLLATDAGELDLLLQYPKAIQGQVEEYLDVYRSSGGAVVQLNSVYP
jgi:hypothetical protein